MKNETIKTYKTLETITRVITEELDPCIAPDGCPELEPWMAYVGLGEDVPNSEDFEYWSFSPISLEYEGHYHGHSNGRRYFVDVRTEWAQEHFPEHCRIRNYQEPDAFEEFAKKMNHSYAVAGGELYILAAAAGGRSLLREAYKLGQANPQPTK
jgi:hypothetical protein